MPSQEFRLPQDCSANPVTRHSKDPANDSPSLGGEGRDEGECSTIPATTRPKPRPVGDGIFVAIRLP